MTVKVSVVIPTYTSPPELDNVIESLDAQSLPSSDFEVILVDDGSPDGTFERLQKIASTRPNIRVEQIQNSGWPGRPRNVGVSMAEGEYIFFSDHDDYVFPEALERMYNFALINNLDVVHPKEVVRGWSTPGWVTWRQQRPHLAQLDQPSLQCITPHKLYRRSFLNNADIRFPEGRVRLEDFSFNALAWARTDAIGIMSDYPCYRWVIYDDNSHKKGYDYDSYWQSFRDSLKPIVTELPPGEKRNHLLVRWYRSRILERLNGQFQGQQETYQTRLLQTFSELLPLFPEHLDNYLNSADRARSYLLRQGLMGELVELSKLDRGMKLAGTDVRIEWHDGRLHLLLTGRIVDAEGAAFRVEKRGDRLFRSVPTSLRHAAPDSVWDLTDELKSVFAEIAIRARSTSVDWIQKSTSDFEIVESENGHSIEFRVATTIDPRTAAMGTPLEYDTWDVFYRVAGLGYTATHRIPLLGHPESRALIGDMAVTAYPAKNGFLALKVTANKNRASVQSDRPPGSSRSLPFNAVYLQLRRMAARALPNPARQRLRRAIDRLK